MVDLDDAASVQAANETDQLVILPHPIQIHLADIRQRRQANGKRLVVNTPRYDRGMVVMGRHVILPHLPHGRMIRRQTLLAVVKRTNHLGLHQKADFVGGIKPHPVIADRRCMPTKKVDVRIAHPLQECNRHRRMFRMVTRLGIQVAQKENRLLVQVELVASRIEFTEAEAIVLYVNHSPIAQQLRTHRV